MITDRPLYDAMAAGLERAETQMEDLGIKGWRVAMVAYDPQNPRAYMVLGTAGDEAFQSRIVSLVNPEDAGKGPDFVATPNL